jgi:heme-degrading monooxygenase HmoA
MIAVIFELRPEPGCSGRYFELAAALRPALEAQDGFVSVERYRSLARPDHFLSLSFWRDEDAVRRWRCHAGHRQAQQQGRDAVLADYRLRVATVVRDYGLAARTGTSGDSLPALT